MQEFYGDEVRIIEKKRIKPHKNSNSGRPRRGNKIALFIIAVCFAALIATAALSGINSDSITVKAKSWYYVSMFDYTVSDDAKLGATVVKEAGGAGYIVNDGTLHVTAAVYASQSDAKSVAEKQTMKAEVYKVTVQKVKFDSVKDKKTSKTVEKAFTYYETVYKNVTAAVTEYEQGRKTESELMLAVNEAKRDIAATREKLNAVFGETDCAEVGALCDYLYSAEKSLDDAVLGEAGVLFTSRLRYALCEIIDNRIKLGKSLAKM